MSLKVLITGQGKFGSWKIRGEQLGHAMGATVRPQADSANGYDVVVIVKRLADAAILRSASRHGVPVVWDIVDAWPQPSGNAWTREASLAWLSRSMRLIEPTGVIAATKQMAQDVVSLQGPIGDVTTLRHHAWQGKPINPIRTRVRTIGYQGGVRQLGKWAGVLAEEANKRGWNFVVNPASLADVDIALALRDSTGYAPMHWKSNVKLANAQASGTPIILARESGYLETASKGEFWADTVDELRTGLDWLSDHAHRVEASRLLLGTEPKLESIVDDYKRWLQQVGQRSVPAADRAASPWRRRYAMAMARMTGRLPR